MSVDSSALRAAIQVYAEQVCEQAASLAFDQLDPPVDTGELRQSGFNRSAGTHIEFGYEADQALYTDQGTGAHPIPTPVAFNGRDGFVVIVPQSSPHMQGRVSAFEAEDGTTIIMGMPEVQHPGTPGTFWWTDVIGDEGTLDGLLAIVQEVADTTTVTA